MFGRVVSRMREDIAAAQHSDPAAGNSFSVAVVYSGLHAVWCHRVHNALWRRGYRFLPRLLAQLTRAFTGVEIHPAATIGRRLFIDHGMGVVIGETAVIGDDCVLYHGTTLGGTGRDCSLRHPRLGDRVVVGAGAKLLGPIAIGDDVRVGAGAVVLKSAPAGVTLVGVPAREVAAHGEAARS